MIKVTMHQLIDLGVYIEEKSGLAPRDAKIITQACILVMQGKTLSSPSDFVTVVRYPKTGRKVTIKFSDLRETLEIPLLEVPIKMNSGTKVERAIYSWRLYIGK
jgi:hypothetical protein